MTQILTLPSGQTMLLPDDKLPDPKLTWEQALEQAENTLLQGSLPVFIGKIHRKLHQTKEDIALKVAQQRMSVEQGWLFLANALFEAEAHIAEEHAKVAHVDCFEDEQNS